ncbi:MAG: NAD(P)-dependent oxidoreductase [Thiomonas sp.]|uniref:NAD-dependent epimerase/dehydratase family protein n=1 Tax=Thiomonas sp. TaxID=2047785 RepID=UPI002A35A70D|nr:NAD(P)-dependent oxidoreductase [Thiomonas sp.]MDY0331648.1 NAD(P)-dependent oxidoreductase [Thiomonas sp.]
MNGQNYEGQPMLVTGGTGFIGGHLVARLLQQGARVKVLVRDTARLPEAWRGRVQVCQGDLTRPDSLIEAAREVRWVFHCAANVQTWGRRQDYEAVNVEGLRNLLHALTPHAGRIERLVHVSTVDVYGFPKTPCDEGCAPRMPGFGYGDSKLRGELLLRELALMLHLPYTILRPANVMGPGSPFTLRVGRELRNGLMLRVSGGQVDAGFLYVDNLIDALLWAGLAPQAKNEVFNVNDPQPITWRQFLDDLRTSIDGRGWIIDLPYPVAAVAAAALALPYRLLGIRQEPLLHPLIVKIFGRSCGHSAAKLAAAGCPLGRIAYRQGMAESARWFQEACGK